MSNKREVDNVVKIIKEENKNIKFSFTLCFCISR